MTPESMDAVFQALASASRRRILDVVRGSPGCNVNDVCGYFEISRIAVMKHLRILEAANLMSSQKEGRVRRLYFNAAPIQLIYDRWTSEYSAFWAGRLMDIKFSVESKGGDAKPKKRGKRKSKKKGESDD